MEPERWRQIERLYHSASQLTPEQRSRFLDEVTSGNDQLRQEVLALLSEASISTRALLGGALSDVAAEIFTLECRTILPVGSELGPYRIEAIIGAGGMGDVYRARDTRLDRAVALKVLRSHRSNEGKIQERLRCEARAASALSHPNICAVYDIGVCGEQPFLVMEYLEGRTLRERLRAAPLTLQELLRWAVQIADALDTAHVRGIVHSDIKAANVFVTNRGEIKILDFGIAQVLHRAPAGDADVGGEASFESIFPTAAQEAAGTVAYMSPEQVRRQPLDTTSDLFSFGVLLYEMATGTLPFAAESTEETFHAICYREPPPIHHSRSDVPRKLEEIVGGALTKDRHARVQTAAALRDSLAVLKHKLETESALPVEIPDQKPSYARFLRPGKSAALFALIAIALGAVLLYFRSRAPHGGRTLSLAVLPFEDHSGDPGNAYLAAGLTEAVDRELSKISALRVIRTPRKPSLELARDLHPDAVLDASLERSGKEVLVSAKIVQPPLNRRAWSKEYRRFRVDLPAIQGEMAREIADALRVRVTPQERAQLAAPLPVGLEAYDAYLRGRQFWTRQTARDMRKAAEEFRRSIEESPSYAPAYAGLADCYSMLGWFAVLAPLDVLDAARAAARKAEQLDPNLAEAHISAGIISGFFDWDWPAAEQDFKKAIDLNPSLADGHHWHAHMLEAVGRQNEALAELKQAHELDALYPLIDEDLTLAYLFRRDYGSALAQVRKMLELQPNFWRVHHLLGKVYREKRMYPEAIAEFELAVRLSDSNVMTSASLGHIYALSGKPAEARRILNDLIGRFRKSYIDPEPIAEIYIGLGQKDEALYWLEKACAYHVPRFGWLARREPLYDGLRSDPRFQRLLKRMRLVQASLPLLMFSAGGKIR